MTTISLSFRQGGQSVALFAWTVRDSVHTILYPFVIAQIL